MHSSAASLIVLAKTLCRAYFCQILFKGRKSVIGHMVFDPFCIKFGNILGHTNSDEETDNGAVPRPNPVRKRGSGIGQKHAAIGLRRGKPLSLQARNGLSRRWLGNAHPRCDIGDARLSHFRMEIADHLHVIFQQRD